MKVHPLAIIVPIVVAAVAVIGLQQWYAVAAPTPAVERVPLKWDRDTGGGVRDVPDRLVAGPGQAPDLWGAWPQFRGADRTGKAVSDEALLAVWPPAGPRVLWRTGVGEGYAGAAIHKGRVYLLDYDRGAGENVLRCLSLTDGRDIWRYSFAVTVKFNHGMSRTVPAVTDDAVVAIGPKCNVRCVDARTGELRWSMNMVRQFGATVPQWYTGQCPLIDGDRVILAPGGEPFLMAVNLSDGTPAWTVPNPGGWVMTHSSVTPAEFGGVKQYVYCGSRGVIAVAADDGRELWRWTGWRIAIATSPSPVRVGDDRLLFTGDYNAGSQMIRVTRDGDAFRVEELFRLPAKTFSCKQQTPLYDREHLFTVLPGGHVTCIDAAGAVRWVSPGKVSSGWGPFMFINDRLYTLNDETGELIVADAGPHGYRKLARAKVLAGHEAWAPMAFADGRLVLRDFTEMVCLDLTADQNAGAEEASE